MSLSPDLATVIREETRRALGAEPTPASVLADLRTVVLTTPPEIARTLLAELAALALEGLQALSPAEPEPVIPTASIAAPAAEQEAENG